MIYLHCGSLTSLVVYRTGCGACQLNITKEDFVLPGKKPEAIPPPFQPSLS